MFKKYNSENDEFSLSVTREKIPQAIKISNGNVIIVTTLLSNWMPENGLAPPEPQKIYFQSIKTRGGWSWEIYVPARERYVNLEKFVRFFREDFMKMIRPFSVDELFQEVKSIHFERAVRNGMAAAIKD